MKLCKNFIVYWYYYLMDINKMAVPTVCNYKNNRTLNGKEDYLDYNNFFASQCNIVGHAFFSTIVYTCISWDLLRCKF